MRVGDRWYRTIWPSGSRNGAITAVEVIDQTVLPERFEIRSIGSSAEMRVAIADMVVRGAPLIGAAGAFGLALAMAADPSDESLRNAHMLLAGARPTAVNLRWALDRMRLEIEALAAAHRARAAAELATALADEDVAVNMAIGGHGADLLAPLAAGGSGATNVMTHCNAGWLATVDWGTALSPIYRLHDAGQPIHVWVSETRPRNQGARLTAWELGSHGVPHTLIADNVAGHLMRTGQVDAVIVGTDRTAANGDVANKVGTYLKALAAFDCGVPFYVAAPTSSIDFTLAHGDLIPIEERAGEELLADAHAPPATAAANPAFDVTPSRLVTKLISERGVIDPDKVRAWQPPSP